METLKDRLINQTKGSHKVWFERWVEEENIEKELLKAASQGFFGYAISFPKNDEYLARRLRDSQTVELLKEKFPSITINYKKTERKNIINQTYYTEKIVFDWSESNG